MRKPVIGVLGATGVVGRHILEILQENNVEFEDIKFLASKKSAGKEIEFKDKKYPRYIWALASSGLIFTAFEHCSIALCTPIWPFLCRSVASL